MNNDNNGSNIVPFTRTLQHPLPVAAVIEVEIEAAVITLQAVQLQKQLEHLSTLVVQGKCTIHDLNDMHHNMVSHAQTCNDLMNAVN